MPKSQVRILFNTRETLIELRRTKNKEIISITGLKTSETIRKTTTATKKYKPTFLKTQQITSYQSCHF